VLAARYLMRAQRRYEALRCCSMLHQVLASCRAQQSGLCHPCLWCCNVCATAIAIESVFKHCWQLLRAPGLLC
jgi:hypothetical protein